MDHWKATAPLMNSPMSCNKTKDSWANHLDNASSVLKKPDKSQPVSKENVYAPHPRSASHQARFDHLQRTWIMRRMSPTFDGKFSESMDQLDQPREPRHKFHQIPVTPGYQQSFSEVL
jgi:hypothetical protein